MDLTLEILKWALLVFVAGAIGQFGRALTSKILARRREAGGVPPRLDGSIPDPDHGKSPSREERKLRKKQAKAEYKQRKKQEP